MDGRGFMKRGMWGFRIRCRKRQERWPEGQKNDWKSSAGGHGGVGAYLEYASNLYWGRIPRVNGDGFS